MNPHDDALEAAVTAATEEFYLAALLMPVLASIRAEVVSEMIRRVVAAGLARYESVMFETETP